MDVISTPAFKEHVESLMQEWHVPGLSIAVFNSTSIEARGFGKVSIDREDEATQHTLYDWASCSKSLTAAAVGKLVDSGRCEWSSIVSEILPDDFVLPDQDKTLFVTVEDILCHRTGMPGHDFSFFGENSENADNPRSITRKLRHLPSAAPLRTKYYYCNMMFTVASYLVEKVSGQSFASFLKDNIFNVLGMDSAYLQPSAAQAGSHASNLSAGHVWIDKQQKYNIIPKRDQYEGQGAGLIQASVVDFAKWCQAILTKNSKLFNDDIYSTLLQPRVVVNPDEIEADFSPFEGYTMYALGWTVLSYRGHRLISHGGSESGFRSGMYMLPSKDFGLVMAGSCAGASEVNETIANELMDHILDCQSPYDWPQHRRDRIAKQRNETTQATMNLRGKLSNQEVHSDRGPPPSIPISAYTGQYQHKGYGKMEVSIKDDAPYIDATDRGLPITLSLEHVHDNRAFIAYMQGEDEEGFPSEARFEVDANDRVTRLGLMLDGDWEELIWFEKQ